MQAHVAPCVSEPQNPEAPGKALLLAGRHRPQDGRWEVQLLISVRDSLRPARKGAGLCGCEGHGREKIVTWRRSPQPEHAEGGGRRIVCREEAAREEEWSSAGMALSRNGPQFALGR